MKKLLILCGLVLFLQGCEGDQGSVIRDQETVNEKITSSVTEEKKDSLTEKTVASVPSPNLNPNHAKAYFAGGCFWCTEASFEKLPGVQAAVSGFANGEEENPEYKQVASGNTGHREAVAVTYDPNVISYRTLVDEFWKMFDPTDVDGSFYDRGFQYSSGIFYETAAEQVAAEESLAAVTKLGVFPAPIVTPIELLSAFYEAEEYHQDYYKKKPLRYKYYRNGSGRDKYIESIWGKK